MPLSDHIKPGPNPPLTMPRVIRARELYAEGFTVARVIALCEMSLGTLYNCLDGVPFGDQDDTLPPIPRRRQVLQRHRVVVSDGAGTCLSRGAVLVLDCDAGQLWHLTNHGADAVERGGIRRRSPTRRGSAAFSRL